ncbi:MAG TPA: hypothetical protein DIC18_00375, partial [Clostridiales bacterium]|nr:hypothetical protein [Clostridiales bacterium]
MDKTLENLKQMADGETVVGREIIAPDGTMVIPISKLSVGMVSGGGEYGLQRINGEFTGAGAGGAGATVTPLGFLLLGKFSHSFIRVDGKEEDDKWMNVLQTVAKVF